MKKTVWAFLMLLMLGDGFAKAAKSKEQEVVNNYADVVHATYADSLMTAAVFAGKVSQFSKAPSEAQFEELKKAWLEARIPYLQSEAFRFYGGPIDDDNGPEGLLNAWPMDESYIDYVNGSGEGGIIANVSAYPEITAEVLRSLNEKAGETNISSGYHALEFLLWGQDMEAGGPGARAFTDYTTALNADRRLQYLMATTELLLENLNEVLVEWVPGRAGNYRAAFEAASPEESLKKIFTGISMLSGFELSGERLMVAYDTQEQEDEHSCFSDTTHLDAIYDTMGIQNVYLGRYGNVKGPGLRELVSENDGALAKALEEKIAASIANAKAIPVPFDQAILGDDESPGRRAILATVESLEDFAQLLANASQKMGFEVPISEDE